MINKRRYTEIVKDHWRLTPDGYSISIDKAHHSKRYQFLQNPKYLHQAILASEYFSEINKVKISCWYEKNAFPSKLRPILSWQNRLDFSLGSIIVALHSLEFEYRFKWYEPFEPCFGISRTVLEHDLKHMSMILNC